MRQQSPSCSRTSHLCAFKGMLNSRSVLLNVELSSGRLFRVKPTSALVRLLHQEASIDGEQRT